MDDSFGGFLILFMAAMGILNGLLGGSGTSRIVKKSNKKSGDIYIFWAD